MHKTLNAAILAVLLIAIPGVDAGIYTYGSSVTTQDYDLSPIASTSAADKRYALCFGDADGVPGPSDPVILVLKPAVAGTCPASIELNPASGVLLNTIGPVAAGTEINKLHAYARTPLTDIDAAGMHAVRYFEEGTDTSKADPKDVFYIDIRNLAGMRVDVGDLRITAGGGRPVGTFVSAGDVDVNLAIREIGALTRLVSDASIVYKAGSGYYMNVDAGVLGGVVGSEVTGDLGVEVGDLRLNIKAVTPFTDAPLIEVESIELFSDTVTPGSWFQATILAKNNGKGPGAGLVETSVAGLDLDARGTPTLDPGASAKLILNLPAPNVVGTHRVTAGDTTVILYVEGEPAAQAGGASLATVEALEARIAHLESRLASATAMVPPAPALAAQAEESHRDVSKEKAPAPGVFLVALALAALALVGRARQT